MKQSLTRTFWWLLALSPPAIVFALGHLDLVQSWEPMCVSFLLIGPMLALTRDGTGIQSFSDGSLKFLGELIALITALCGLCLLFSEHLDVLIHEDYCGAWTLNIICALPILYLAAGLLEKGSGEVIGGLIAGRQVPAEIVPSKVDTQTDKPPLDTSVSDYRTALIEYFTYYDKSHFVAESEIGFQAEIERASANEIAEIIFNEMGVNDWYKKRSDNPQEFNDRNQRLGAIEYLLPEDSDDTLDFEPKGGKKKSGVVDYADALTRVRCSQCDHPTEGGPRRGTYLCTNCGFMFDSHGNAI